MKRLILQLAVATLAFGFGLVVDRVSISSTGGNEPTLQPPLPAAEKLVAPTPVIVTPTPSPTPHTVFDFDQRKFDPDGAYFIAGNRPKDFDEFSHLTISPFVQDGQLRGDVWLLTETHSTNETIPAAFALVTQRRVVFVSRQSNDGFEYRFDGEFLYKNLYAVANKENTPVLRGTLTKIKNGQKVAEAVVSFWLEQFHGC
jgi:hypothetical protein